MPSGDLVQGRWESARSKEKGNIESFSFRSLSAASSGRGNIRGPENEAQREAQESKRF
jgi:hypothetical protein